MVTLVTTTRPPRRSIDRSIDRSPPRVCSHRLRARRSLSAERRRTRNLLAAKKKEAELKEARREADAAHYRQEVSNLNYGGN